MKKTDLQEERLLELNFVDIGQGDGTFIVTPDDRFMLIDAGEADNMFRFLSWRFTLRHHPDRVITIPTTVMTHPDQDRYKALTNRESLHAVCVGAIALHLPNRRARGIRCLGRSI